MNKLPIEFRDALQALKDQASAATAQLVTGDRKYKQAELADAQSRMAQYEPETTAINRLLMNTKDETLDIETLDEQRLAQELGFV
jgi:hypothetical protein